MENGTSNSKPLKSILKRTEQSQKPPADEENDSLGESKPSVSKGVRDRLAADDAEIAALEKALGIKGKKKLPKSFEDDGLDALLDDLGESRSELHSGPGKRKRSEEEEWLERKRLKAREGEVYDEGSDAEPGDLLEDEDPSEGESDEVRDEGLDSVEEDFSGFESETSSPPPPKKRVRENPYVAPSTSDAGVSTKYIPPSLRGPATSDIEALSRIRRQAQGILNRLSEANMISILGDVEKLYRDNPRQHVTSTLVDILLSLMCDRTTLQDTFVILHAGFIVAIYKIIGTDFGAQAIQRVVEAFTRFYEPDAEGNAKESTNLVSLIAELYNFQMIGSTLIFDYIRMFLRELSEVNTELLLKIMRSMVDSFLY